MIGLTDIAKEGDFVWESGEELSYENWFSNQPNDKDNFQDIVEIDRAGLWNDVDNDLSLEFVLEIPCEFVTQVSGPQQGADLTPGIYTVTYVIADGCGLEEYCSFDLLVEDGLWMTCIDDIIVRISSTEGSAIVEFELPEASSCCNQCTNQNDCAIVTQVDGPPSGSSFALNSTTAITYRATDPCGNKLECSFNIIIEERAGSRLGNGSYGGNIERGTTDNEEEIIITDYKYYPNPVSDILTIETPDHADINRISIMSLEGQTISELSSISSSNKISMENLIPGLYLVLIEYHSGDIRYEKIMKI